MASSKKFAELWDFTSAEHQQKISLNQTFEKAATGGAALLMLANGKKLGKVGLAVSAAAGAASFALSHRMYKQNLDAWTKIRDDYTKPAPLSVQTIAKKLFAKAGINHAPNILVLPERKADAFLKTSLNPDKLKTMSNEEFKAHLNKRAQEREALFEEEKKMRSEGLMFGMMYKQAQHGVFTLSDEAFKQDGKATIIIGQTVLDTLSKEELTAVLAHETSHVKLTQPGQKPEERLYQRASTGLIGAFALGSLVTGTWSAWLPTAAMNFGKRMANTKTVRADEERADRNSIGLYPHPTALKTALEKVYKLQHKANAVDENSASYKFNQKVLAVHNGLEQRLNDIDKFLQETEKFYADNAMPFNTRDITPQTAPRNPATAKRTRKNKGPGA